MTSSHARESTRSSEMSLAESIDDLASCFRCDPSSPQGYASFFQDMGNKYFSPTQTTSEENDFPAQRYTICCTSIGTLSASNADCRLVCSEKVAVDGGGGKDHTARQRAPTRRVAQMRLNELCQYFNMPINEASKELKVGVTVLKRKCREFGVTRWPHRKIKSLDSLIHSIQDSAKVNEGKVKDRAVLIAKTLEEERKLMQTRPETELDNRIKRLRQASFKNNFKSKRRQMQAVVVNFESTTGVHGVEHHREAACGSTT